MTQFLTNSDSDSRRAKKAQMAAYNSRKKRLTAKQRIFVDEYVKSKDVKASALAAGISERSATSQGFQWLDPELYPLVVIEVNRLLKIIEEQTVLEAQDIRQRISEVVNVSLLDWFTPDQGGWVIDIEAYKELPIHIKRMIEAVDIEHVEVLTKRKVKNDAGDEEEVEDWVEKDRARVRFVSKTFALGLAAKYSLTEKHQHDVNLMTLDLDKLYADQAARGRKSGEEDPVERRIREAREVKAIPPPAADGENKPNGEP